MPEAVQGPVKVHAWAPGRQHAQIVRLKHHASNALSTWIASGAKPEMAPESALDKEMLFALQNNLVHVVIISRARSVHGTRDARFATRGRVRILRQARLALRPLALAPTIRPARRVALIHPADGTMERPNVLPYLRLSLWSLLAIRTATSFQHASTAHRRGGAAGALEAAMGATA